MNDINLDKIDNRRGKEVKKDDRVNDISKMMDRIRRMIVIIRNNNDKRNEEERKALDL